MDGGQAYAWSRIGGHLALDLCNTVSWRLDPARTIERLPDAAHLVDWFCELTGEPVEASLRACVVEQSAEAAATLEAVRDLRGATTRFIDARLDQTLGTAEDAAIVGTAWRKALEVAELPLSLPLIPTIVPSTLPRLTSYLALSVTNLLQGAELRALGRCDGDGCGWLFLDTTRNHSRRWCDSSDCGNRARVRNYAARQRPH